MSFKKKECVRTLTVSEYLGKYRVISRMHLGAGLSLFFFVLFFSEGGGGGGGGPEQVYLSNNFH